MTLLPRRKPASIRHSLAIILRSLIFFHGLLSFAVLRKISESELVIDCLIIDSLYSCGDAAIHFIFAIKINYLIKINFFYMKKIAHNILQRI